MDTLSNSCTSRKCKKCERRIQISKPSIRCCICEQLYHPKCQNLTPIDIQTLHDNKLHQSWSCTNCNAGALPLFYSDDYLIGSDHLIKKRKKCAKNCYTCSKIGMNLKSCVLCGNKSHARCQSLNMGCKRCLLEIYPGYALDNFRKLFIDTTRFNTTIFNPYDMNDTVNSIGTADSDDSEIIAEQEIWTPLSNRLLNCNYIDLDTIKETKVGELKTLTMNIRSLVKNFSKITDDIKYYNRFDILCFNETMCSVEDLPFKGKELELENFHPPFVQKPARDSNRGGGLVIYLNKKLCSYNDCKVLDDLSENTDFKVGEFFFVEISRENNKNIIIGNMYRSPSKAADPNNFVNNLEQKLKLLEKHKNKIIALLGDSNIDLLKIDAYQPAKRYFDLLQEHGFAPLISRPTRITNHSATLIDHIFTNHCSAVTNSGVITTDVSDHLTPCATFLIDRKKLNGRNFTNDTYQTRTINEENLENFKTKIREINWNFVSELSDANNKYSAFENKYNEIYNECFPIQTLAKKRRKINQPWILPWLQCACERKNKLYRKFVKRPSVENEQIYLKMKLFVAKHIRKVKAKYYADYFKRYSNDGRKQWQMINKILNKQAKNRGGISKLIDGEEAITDPVKIAEKFNNFFCNIAQKLKDEEKSAKIPLELKYAKRCLINMPTIPCTLEEIEICIKNFKNKATSDLAVNPLKNMLVRKFRRLYMNSFALP